MFKQVVLLKRKPGMSFQEFKDYYENHHSVLGAKFLQGARRYVRRYVQPEKGQVTGEVRELDFDVVMEIWWDSREAQDEAMKAVADNNILPLFIEDEKKLFDGHNNRTFTVEEYDTELPRSVIKEKGWPG